MLKCCCIEVCATDDKRACLGLERFGKLHSFFKLRGSVNMREVPVGVSCEYDVGSLRQWFADRLKGFTPHNDGAVHRNALKVF